MVARRVLLAVAILFAVGEALDSIDVGVIGIVFALLFAIGAWLLWRGRPAGVVLVGILVVFEVAVWPTLHRDNAVDWVIQVPFLLVGLVGLAALGVIVVTRVRKRLGSPASI